MNAFKKLKFSKDGIGAVLLKIDSDDVTVVVDKVRRRPCLAANTAVRCSGESRGQRAARQTAQPNRTKRPTGTRSRARPQRGRQKRTRKRSIWDLEPDGKGKGAAARPMDRVRAGDAHRLAGRRGGRAGRCEPTVSPQWHGPQWHGPHGIPFEPLRTEWRS